MRDLGALQPAEFSTGISGRLCENLGIQAESTGKSGRFGRGSHGYLGAPERVSQGGSLFFIPVLHVEESSSRPDTSVELWISVTCDQDPKHLHRRKRTSPSADGTERSHDAEASLHRLPS